jgi:hypothetical protein
MFQAKMHDLSCVVLSTALQICCLGLMIHTHVNIKRGFPQEGLVTSFHAAVDP